MAGLHVFMGPMFAQKTTFLISHLKKGSVKESTICVNSIKDVRCDDDEIKSHDGKCFTAVKVASLHDLESNDLFQAAAIVGIDEVQFFCDNNNKNEFYNFFKKWSQHKCFIIAGLDGTSDQQPWPWLCIIPLADKVRKITAFCCKCPTRVDAPFTKCKIQKDQIELIGGSELYYPVCRKHLYEY